jgi:hypothetical protein
MGVTVSLIMPAPTGRILYDSIVPRGILSAPAAARPRGTMVAYYLNGDFAVGSVAAVEELFPPDYYRLLPIDVRGTRPGAARAADVETGDMTPEMLEQWLQDFAGGNPGYAGGARGEIYCNRSSIAAVRAGTGRYVLGRDYCLWVATGDGTVYWQPGVNACQNVWGRLYDQSVIFDAGFLPGPGSVV